MGNSACCCEGEEDSCNTTSGADLMCLEAQPVLADAKSHWPGLQAPSRPRQMKASELDLPRVRDGTYQVRLEKQGNERLGLDVDYMEGRTVLPILELCGGLAQAWNKADPPVLLRAGDAVVAANGARCATSMLERLRDDKVLELTLRSELSYKCLVADIERLVEQKRCGPLLVRLSFHDSAVYSTGKLAGGRSNAAMRLAGAGEAAFPANAGLPEIAIPLLSNISAKYCPILISHADLWALAANVAIRMMGGPDVPTRFGRVDAETAADSVASQLGRLPDANMGPELIRKLFAAKGFDDRHVVALSAAHALARSPWDGALAPVEPSPPPPRFDTTYFKHLLQRYATMRLRATGAQIRLPFPKAELTETDLALVRDPDFRRCVEAYAGDPGAFHRDFATSWARLQECGWINLRDSL